MTAKNELTRAIAKRTELGTEDQFLSLRVALSRVLVDSVVQVVRTDLDTVSITTFESETRLRQVLEQISSQLTVNWAFDTCQGPKYLIR